LKTFKAWCAQRGIIEEFENVQDFKQRFFRHLQITLRDNPYLSKLLTTPQADIIQNAQNAEPLPALSSEAIVLLIETARDKNGNVLSFRHMAGHTIQANSKTFGDSKDRRSMARWEHAIEQLVSNDLIVPRGHKGEVFEITEAGYQLSEKLEKQADQLNQASKPTNPPP
jgi:hypothetical protein